MTGEEIMHISRALSIMAEELSEVGLKGGEETVSDEVLDEATAFETHVARLKTTTWTEPLHQTRTGIDRRATCQ